MCIYAEYHWHGVGGQCNKGDELWPMSHLLWVCGFMFLPVSAGLALWLCDWTLLRWEALVQGWDVRRQQLINPLPSIFTLPPVKLVKQEGH